jgi:hypothetical protein
VTNRQPQGPPPHRPIVDGMEEVRLESPEPTCLGGYWIFGRSMHRTLTLEVVGIGGHAGDRRRIDPVREPGVMARRGWFTLQHPAA